jgi:hypothetical protein
MFIMQIYTKLFNIQIILHFICKPQLLFVYLFNEDIKKTI